MIGFANLILLSGLAAAAAPVLIHIAHRRRHTSVSWAAMRFLVETLQARRRRLMIEHWLLLAVRMAVLTCIALALSRPFLTRAADAGVAIERGGAVAAVLLIDDSLSASAGRAEPAFASAKRLADAYLATLRKGDEISILTMSKIGAPAADPIFDRDAAREILAQMTPTAVASDVPALLAAGVAQLTRHVNPSGELVLIGDGRAAGWATDDRARWDELRRRITAPAGGRAAARVVLLAPENDEPGANLALTAITVDRALVPAARPVHLVITIARHGEIPASGAVVRLSVDGRAVGELPLPASAAASHQLIFTHTFAEAGSHLVEASLEGARDALPADDRRALAVEVERGVPVLLVEGVAGTRLDGSLGLVAAALDPGGDGRGLFALTRVSAAQLDPSDLATQRVVVLGDVPALDARSVAALEAFVVAGGGVLVAPGPNTDVALINRYWARGGHGFLPTAVDRIVVASDPPVPTTVAASHPALHDAFGANGQVAWRGARVHRYLALQMPATPVADLDRLIGLGNGDPLVVERARGHGRVVLITTSLDPAWTDLPRQAAFVPLVRGLVAHLGSVVLPPRNLRPGDRIAWLPPSGVVGESATLEGPDGLAVVAAPSDWEGRQALVSASVLAPGGYLLRVVGAPTARFALASDPAESALDPLPAAALAALAPLAITRFADADTVAVAFSSDHRRAVELWRWLVAAAVALLFAETLLTRRQANVEAAGEKRAALGTAA